MGFVEQLIYLIQGEHDHTHEHLMSALLELIRDNKQGITECQKPPLQFKEVLLQRIHQIHGKEEFQVDEWLLSGFPFHILVHKFPCEMIDLLCIFRKRSSMQRSCFLWLSPVVMVPLVTGKYQYCYCNSIASCKWHFWWNKDFHEPWNIRKSNG